MPGSATSSSMQSTIAFCGGARYKPTTSVTFPTSSGSVENRNDSLRQGWIPASRQIAATLASPMPRCLASSRVDQCVTAYFFGGGRSVAAITRARSMLRGRPSAARPATRPHPWPGTGPASRSPSDATPRPAARSPCSTCPHRPATRSAPLRQPGRHARCTRQPRQLGPIRFADQQAQGSTIRHTP